MDHTPGLAPFGRAKSALGCALFAPVHQVRPGVWLTPIVSAVILLLQDHYCKPSLGEMTAGAGQSKIRRGGEAAEKPVDNPPGDVQARRSSCRTISDP